LVVSKLPERDDQIMKILITGATGLIGKQLATELLKNGDEVKAVSRTKKSISFLPPSHISVWEIGKTAIDLKFVEGVDAVVHLAGAPVMEKAWSPEYRKEIFDSRVQGTREWAEALAKLPAEKRPSIFISGSAIGIYGDRGDEVLDEHSSHGSDFLAEVAIAWEKETKAIADLGIRVVCLRTGIVLSRNGGALAQMQPVVLGDGKAWFSWIHLEDEVGIIRFALNNDQVRGAINLTSPNPVTNRRFTETFARVKHVPVILSTPTFVLKTVLGDRAEAILTSQRVLPRAIEALGYAFKFTNIDSAMDDLYPKGGALNEHLLSAQFIPAPLAKVFSFFSEAKNLETLTPDFVGFKILKQSTARIEKGTLIDYRINVHGLPLKWRTLIAEWNEGKSFVDTQLKGPYSYWHHEHSFYSVPEGTLMLDHVTYRVPAGILGKAVAGKFIQHDVKKIFDFRTTKIDEIFGEKARVQ
jgi:uncharacterized protein (TIGR01777 family)